MGQDLLRLLAAALCGAVLGFERSRQNRTIMGFRTLSLVSLASCVAVLAILRSGLPGLNADAIGRVVQGVLSGVGFVGAGVIIHGGNASRVHGLATAASIWLASALGVAAALAEWRLLAGGIAIAIGVLTVGAPVERWIRRQARGSGAEQADHRDIDADL